MRTPDRQRTKHTRLRLFAGPVALLALASSSSAAFVSSVDGTASAVSQQGPFAGVTFAAGYIAVKLMWQNRSRSGRDDQ